MKQNRKKSGFSRCQQQHVKESWPCFEVSKNRFLVLLWHIWCRNTFLCTHKQPESVSDDVQLRNKMSKIFIPWRTILNIGLSGFPVKMMKISSASFTLFFDAAVIPNLNPTDSCDFERFRTHSMQIVTILANCNL